MTDFQPYNGPAAEPEQVPFERVDGGGPALTAIPDYNPVTQQTAVIPQPSAPILPGIVSTPPPVDPVGAQQLAELNHKLGNLINAVGNLQKENETLRMEREIERAAAYRTPQPQIPALPEGLNPSQPVTLGDFNNVLYGQIIPGVQASTEAQVIRATLGITSEEEASIASRFPSLPTQEPARSRALQRIVPMLRGATPTQATAAPTAPTRSASATVPVVEAPQQSIGEARPVDPLAAAHAEFQRAEQIKDPEERLNAQRIATEKWEKAAGISNENQKFVGFRQTL